MYDSMRFHGLSVIAGITLISATLAAGERPERPNGGVSFRLAATKALDGYLPMTAPDGSTAYVSSREVFSMKDVQTMRAATAAERETIELSLSPEAADLLTSALKSGGGTSLAIIKGKKLEGIATVAVEGGSTAKLTGLDIGTAARIGRLTVAPAVPEASAVVSVVPRQATGKPNDLFTFDIFVSGISGLKTYQFTLDSSGGDHGRLIRSNGSIDKERSDYLFGTRQVVAAVDNLKGRLGCVVIQGTADATSPKYVGTYVFLASEDAAGEFTVQVRTNSDSFLASERGQEVPYRTVGATVKIAG